MIRVTIAFDVDGTLETSSGPVTLAVLRQLRENGVRVVIVSPSGLRPNVVSGTDFPEFIQGPQRRDNLFAARAEYPAELYLYVSDNGDMVEAEAAGFTYVDRASFRVPL